MIYYIIFIKKVKKQLPNEYKSVIDSVENKKGILYLDYGNYFVPKEKRSAVEWYITSMIFNDMAAKKEKILVK